MEAAVGRPDFADIESGAEFNRWYWLKEEMAAICKMCGLPANGKKFDLRDRIMYALDHNGAVMPTRKPPRKRSKFKWASAPLSTETIITDNVSFGPNFRGFMTGQIGAKFVCHSDFMDWVRENHGKTLGDAVAQWEKLEARKNDPEFQRKIAQQNMLAQYVRDFWKDRPEGSFQEALRCWKWKRRQPMVDGRVVYGSGDWDASGLALQE
ncbi:MAG: DUF6434 domain-containing protein [Salibacteraceae bacterium]